MRRAALAGALGLVMLAPGLAVGAEPLPATVTILADRFEISMGGNVATGVRRAPVSYDSPSALARDLEQPRPVPAAVRVVRSSPAQAIDYTFCVTEDGVLVVGRQSWTLDLPSGRYVFTGGDIKRAYPALEATVPWTWIVEISLAREAGLTLEVRALMSAPVRAVAVTPRLGR